MKKKYFINANIIDPHNSLNEIGGIIIGENDSTEIIFKQIISKGKPLLLQTLNDVIDGKFKLEEQNEKNVTYANKIKKNESKIDWNKSAKEIFLKVRAFYPTPGAWTYLDNGKRVRILIARVLPKSLEYNKKDQNFGLVEDDLIIKCGEGNLAITLLQVEGKVPVKAKEFVNGYKTSYFLNDQTN